MAVPPAGSAWAIAAFAPARSSASATANERPSCGQSSLASWSPAMTANVTPSSRLSTAAAAASFAAAILRPEPIDPLVSKMITSARSLGGVGPAPAAGSPAASTVTTASTVSTPAARYSFWKVSAVNGAVSGPVVTRPPRASSRVLLLGLVGR